MTKSDLSSSIPAIRVVGLLGGIASGKSFVAQEFVRHGAGMLDADRAGHAALRLPEIKTAARDRWGEAVFDSTGQIDRQKLAKIVFAPPPSGPKDRSFLEKITHPIIFRYLAEQAADMASEGVPLAILDAPLILEAAWDKLCERLVFVDAPREVRLVRAQQRGWSEAEFAAREGVQNSLDSKRRRADVIIDNSGSPEHTQAQIERVWQSLVS